MARCEPIDESYNNLRAWGGTEPVEPMDTIDNLSVVYCPKEVCGVRCDSLTSLAAHISAAHYAYAPFECNACSARLPTMAALQTHANGSHSGIVRSQFVVHIEPTKATLVQQCLDAAYRLNVQRLLAELVDAQVEEVVQAKMLAAEYMGDMWPVSEPAPAAPPLTPPIQMSVVGVASADAGRYLPRPTEESRVDAQEHSCSPRSEESTVKPTSPHSPDQPPSSTHNPLHHNHNGELSTPMTLSELDDASLLYAPPSALRKRAKLHQERVKLQRQPAVSTSAASCGAATTTGSSCSTSVDRTVDISDDRSEPRRSADPSPQSTASGEKRRVTRSRTGRVISAPERYQAAVDEPDSTKAESGKPDNDGQSGTGEVRPSTNKILARGKQPGRKRSRRDSSHSEESWSSVHSEDETVPEVKTARNVQDVRMALAKKSSGKKPSKRSEEGHSNVRQGPKFHWRAGNKGNLFLNAAIQRNPEPAAVCD